MWYVSSIYIYIYMYLMDINNWCMKIKWLIKWSIRLETRRETAMPAGCCFNTQWVPGTRGSLRRPWPQLAANLSFLMHVALQETCTQHWPKMSSKASPWYLLRSLKSDCEKVLHWNQQKGHTKLWPKDPMNPMNTQEESVGPSRWAHSVEQLHTKCGSPVQQL
jgi:hypothetical protein